MKYIALLITTFVAVAGCKQANNNDEKKAGISANDSVAAFILQTQPVAKQLAFPGELLPIERAVIYAKVLGYIKSVQVDIGDHVSAGQMLALVEAPEMMAQYEQATSDVFASRSKYLASRDAFERMQQASQQEGTVAGGELERLRNQMMADSATLQSTRAHQSVLANLKEYLLIRAPFSGTVTERKVDAGALVGANNSSPLFTIENTRQLRLRIPVPEAYSAALPADKKLQFSVDALPGETYSATLSRQAGAINLENRTETWEFVTENSNGKLKSGMYITARLQLARNGKSFVVPTTSVATTLEKKFVIALHKGKTEWIDVRQGANINSGNEIFGMLKEGDTLLLRANDEIKPNTSIKAKIVSIQ